MKTNDLINASDEIVAITSIENFKSEYPVYADKYIEKLSEYMETKGKSYSNHYATILSWLKQDIKPTNYSCKEGESL